MIKRGYVCISCWEGNPCKQWRPCHQGAKYGGDMGRVDRIAALVPPPRTHRHRYFGVLAPNSPLRAAVTALAQPVSRLNVLAATSSKSSQRHLIRSAERPKGLWDARGWRDQRATVIAQFMRVRAA